MSSAIPPHPISPLDHGSNSPDERVHHLLEWLRSGRRLTTALAAAAFKVSRRTISRDLAYIRTVLSLDVSFDPTQNSYVLASDHTALPFLAFPSLAPLLLSGETESKREGTDSAPEVKVRYSARAIQGYLSRGGRLDLDLLNEDGTLDAYFPPYKLDEFMSYALSRGHDIEILEPPAFRSRIHMEIRRMLSIYEGDGEASP